MEQKEIDLNIQIFANEKNVQVEQIEVIPKNELVIGQTYEGNCRNADTALWTGTEFEYYRYKFGDVYKETINHFEDDDGYDVFVPMKIKDK